MARHPNYELFEPLGSGENSVVYRAHDLVLGRDVAIKELATEPGSDGGQADAKRVDLFLKEASFLAQFEHENVLRIHTVDKDRGWIVMELMKGTLSSQIAGQPMDADTVRSVLRQMLTALEFLHMKDKVHGAVRPSNILINEHGTVKLSDFEASSLDGELKAPTGSKKYLAPELIRSDFGAFGPTVDLYCLGFTALELLTGSKFDSLFPGTGDGAINADVAWMRWHSSDEPMRPIAEIVKGVPADLASVIDGLLQKSASDRPQSAAEVLKALDDTPIVPVAVPESASPARTQNVGAMLPGKDVKLRQSHSPPRNKEGTKRPASVGKNAAPEKIGANRVLGHPLVLWPLCIGMLVGAVAIGLAIRGGREGEPKPPEEPPALVKGVGKTSKPEDDEPVLPVVEPKPLAVVFNILPDSQEATLLIDGVARSLDGLSLLPGTYQVTVTKPGYEPFDSALVISPDAFEYQISLVAAPDKATAGPPKKAEPKFVEVNIEVSPADAVVRMGGEPAEVVDGVLRLKVEEAADQDFADIHIEASRDGFVARSSTWSWEEVVAADYDLSLALDKMEQPKPDTRIGLPSTLVPKPGTKFDDVTGLPLRVLVRAFMVSAPMEMVLVTAGTYSFGVPEGELRTWELAGDRVEIDEPFYVGVNEVTNRQYNVYAKNSGSDYVGEHANDDLPLNKVSIVQAAKFCDWASGRLPNEREWEAAVRGLNDEGYPLPFNERTTGKAYANRFLDTCHLYRSMPYPGGQKMPSGPVLGEEMAAGVSPLGLQHTIGNVSEWCDGPPERGEFLVKGCSFRIPPGDHVRVTWRARVNWKGADDVGVRLVIPVKPKAQVSDALAFNRTSSVQEVFARPADQQDDAGDTTPKFVYAKKVEDLAQEFKGQAELVIDSGGFMDEITDVSFSPDGQLIAVAGGKLVRIWDVTTGELVTTIRGDMSRTSYGNVNAVEFSPDGQFLIVGVNDYRAHGNIRIYATDNLDEVKELLPGHTAPCRRLCFARDGKYMASVDSDGLMLIWDWPTRTILSKVPARNGEHPILDLMTFPSDKPYLLGIDFDGPVVYSAADGTPVGPGDNMPPRILGWLVDISNKLVKLPYEATVEPRVMDFRMERSLWAGAGSKVQNGKSRFWIRLWESRDPVRSATPVTELGAYDQHRWNVTAMAIQPAGSLVASGDKFGEVHVWDYKTGKRLLKLAGQGKPIYEVAFDENSSRLAFGTSPHGPEDWKRNNYGTATRVLDLRQRAMMDVATAADLRLLNEQSTIGGTSVGVTRKADEAWYHVERKVNGQTAAKYRISAGRNPTVYTLLGEPKLDVQQPVIFGDDEGLLAMWDSEGDELKRAFIGHGSLVSAISAASNGKLIASASTDRTIRLWSLEDYQPTGTFDFKFENSAVREVLAGTSSAKAGVRVGDRIESIDGRSLTEMFELMLLNEFDYKPGQTVAVTMSRGEDRYDYQMTMVQGYDFCEPILNFYVGDDGQWIVWNPQGYYDASPGADRLIGWHLNRGPDKSARFFEVQQFRKQLYRPDIIDGILETGSLEGALAAADSAKYDPDPIDFRDPVSIAENHPPGVRISSPSDGSKAAGSTITVKGEAYSVNGLPITAVTLLHNGSVAKVFRPTKVNQIAMLVEHSVQLEPGANDLVLIAANARSSSQGHNIIVDRKASSSKTRRDAIVLAIGVSEFPDGLGELSSAGADAAAFEEAVKRHKDGRIYGNVQTRLLSGNVSRTDVLDGFQWLSDNTKPGDVVMLFVASHALVDKRDNFYVATSGSDESRSRSTAISWRDLTDTLQLDLPDCKRLVFLDLKPTKNALKPGLPSPLLDLAAPEMGTVFLSASTLQQQPVPTSGNSATGPFMQAVLETVASRTFDTSPTPGDSLFNPVELAAGVSTRVKQLTGDKLQTVFYTPEFVKFTNVLELTK